MAETVVGFFDDRDAAQGAVQDLIHEGFERSNVSVVASDGSGGTATHAVDERGNLAAAGASSGVTSGALVGGVAGVLIGLGFTVLPIAGILLAGPIAGLIAGAASGAVTGGVVGGLVGLGIPKEHAELYAEGIRRGGALVTVETANSSESDRAHRTLDRDGAVDIEERGAAYRSEGFSGYDKDAKPLGEAEIAQERVRYGVNANPASVSDGPSGDKLEVVEETLQVGKREVETGGVRVRSFVTERPVSEQVTLREEHVDVLRTAVDRPATADAFQAGTIEMKEVAEVPVMAKEARVVEEISLGKTASDRTETVSDTVRRTDFAVESLGVGEASGTSSGDAGFREHFAAAHPGDNYERYAPAYAYGQQIAGASGGASADWSTNEAAYRSRWEENNPGTWDTFKGSVRHAFESAKSKD